MLNEHKSQHVITVKSALLHPNAAAEREGSIRRWNYCLCNISLVSNSLSILFCNFLHILTLAYSQARWKEKSFAILHFIPMLPPQPSGSTVKIRTYHFFCVFSATVFQSQPRSVTGAFLGVLWLFLSTQRMTRSLNALMGLRNTLQ